MNLSQLVLKLEQTEFQLNEKIKLLAQKDAEIETLKNLLKARRNDSNIVDAHLIYSNAFEEEQVDIVCKNWKEFGELAYMRKFQLIARQECNLNFCIYLASFEDECNLEETLDELGKLIEKKPLEKNERAELPLNRIVPMMKILPGELDKMNGEMDKLRQSLLTKRYERQLRKNQSAKALKEIKFQIDILTEKSNYFQRDEYKQICEYKVFYDQKEFSYIRSHAKLMDKICMNLPFRDNVITLKWKKEELVRFMSLMQRRDYGIDEDDTNVHIMIMMIGRSEYMRKQMKRSFEGPRNMYKRVFNLKDVVGTVHFFPFRDRGEDNYLCLLISGREIIRWCVTDKEHISYLLGDLKPDEFRDSNGMTIKFATPMNVDVSGHEEHFVKVKNEKVFEDHELILKWIRNNFKCLEHDVDSSTDEDKTKMFSKTQLLETIPILYNTFFGYFCQTL